MTVSQADHGDDQAWWVLWALCGHGRAGQEVLLLLTSVSVVALEAKPCTSTQAGKHQRERRVRASQADRGGEQAWLVVWALCGHDRAGQEVLPLLTLDSDLVASTNSPADSGLRMAWQEREARCDR